MGANVIIAETVQEAESLATSQTQFFINVVTNAQQNLQPPVESDEVLWKNHAKAQLVPHFGPVDFNEIPLYNQEKAVVAQMTACSFIGTKESVAKQLKDLRNALKLMRLWR